MSSDQIRASSIFSIIWDKDINRYVLDEEALRGVEFYFAAPPIRELVEKCNQIVNDKGKFRPCCMFFKYGILIFCAATFWGLALIDFLFYTKQMEEHGQLNSRQLQNMIILNICVIFVFNVVTPIALILMSYLEKDELMRKKNLQKIKKTLIAWNNEMIKEFALTGVIESDGSRISIKSSKFIETTREYHYHLGQQVNNDQLRFAKEKVVTKIIPPYAIPTGEKCNDSFIEIKAS